MRMLFSVLALLVVAAVVMKLAATPLRGASPSAGAASSAAPGSAVERQVVDRVNRAIQQGQALAASEASR